MEKCFSFYLSRSFCNKVLKFEMLKMYAIVSWRSHYNASWPFLFTFSSPYQNPDDSNALCFDSSGIQECKVEHLHFLTNHNLRMFKKFRYPANLSPLEEFFPFFRNNSYLFLRHTKLILLLYAAIKILIRLFDSAYSCMPIIALCFKQWGCRT
jgi:hypothetical protein